MGKLPSFITISEDWKKIMDANKEQLFNQIMRNFAFIENLLLYEGVLETHFRTLIELARLLEDTGLRLITNHEDEEEEED